MRPLLAASALLFVTSLAQADAVPWTYDASHCSIDTGDQKRDEHLRSPDFFDVKKYPAVTFKSKSIIKAGDGYRVNGTLKIREVEEPVTLSANVSQPVKTPWGKLVRSVKLGGKIKRSELGLTWNKGLEAGESSWATRSRSTCRSSSRDER